MLVHLWRGGAAEKTHDIGGCLSVAHWFLHTLLSNFCLWVL